MQKKAFDKIYIFMIKISKIGYRENIPQYNEDYISQVHS